MPGYALEELLDAGVQPSRSRHQPRPAHDLWTTTDSLGAGLILYIFLPDRPRLVIMRLVY